MLKVSCAVSELCLWQIALPKRVSHHVPLRLSASLLPPFPSVLESLMKALRCEAATCEPLDLRLVESSTRHCDAILGIVDDHLRVIDDEVEDERMQQTAVH